MLKVSFIGNRLSRRLEENKMKEKVSLMLLRTALFVAVAGWIWDPVILRFLWSG